jgi:hypothetical protein
MKRKYIKPGALSMSFLLACTLLSACSTSNTQNSSESLENSTELETDTSAPAAFYYIDYAQKEDDNLSMSLLVYVRDGTFASDFNADQIQFGQDLSTASNITIESINAKQNKAQISFTLENTDLDPSDLDLNAELVFKAGSILNESSEAQEDLIYEEELCFNDSDKANEPVKATYYKDTKTLVFQISGQGPSSEDELIDSFENLVVSKEENYESNLRVIFDYSNASQDQTNPYASMMGIMDIMADSRCQTLIVNMPNNRAYQILQDQKSRSATRYTYRFISGDGSKIDYSKSSVYDDIEKMISSGSFKEN